VLHFMEEIYTTAPMIMENTRIPEATVYRALKTLRERGVVYPVGSIKKPDSKGGPSVKIWKIHGVKKKWE